MTKQRVVFMIHMSNIGDRSVHNFIKNCSLLREGFFKIYSHSPVGQSTEGEGVYKFDANPLKEIDANFK